MENPDAYPVLYSFRRCPYAMRARLAMAVSGQACTLREVVLADKPAALLQASPKGTVPVLVLPSGEVLEQSQDIMLWALGRNDPQNWLPDTNRDMDDTFALISQCDGPFKHALDRYKYPRRYALPDGLAHRDQGSTFLRTLEARLVAHAHLHRRASGTHFGLADAAIAPFVRQFAHTDGTWFASQTWPALLAWLAAFESAALFDCVMHKYPAWAPGEPIVLFPELGCARGNVMKVNID